MMFFNELYINEFPTKMNLYIINKNIKVNNKCTEITELINFDHVSQLHLAR